MKFSLPCMWSPEYCGALLQAEWSWLPQSLSDSLLEKLGFYQEWLLGCYQDATIRMPATRLLVRLLIWKLSVNHSPTLGAVRVCCHICLEHPRRPMYSNKTILYCDNLTYPFDHHVKVISLMDTWSSTGEEGKCCCWPRQNTLLVDILVNNSILSPVVQSKWSEIQ